MGLFGKKNNEPKEVVVLSPFNGSVKELKDVEDPVFAGEMVGKGFAVAPEASEKVAVSPTSKGSVKMAFETGHAYGIDAGEGLELLIHIGIETVTLEGEGFTAKVAADSKLEDGTVLAEVDLAIINEKAASSDTMVLVTNETVEGWNIERIAGETVKAGEPLFKLTK